MLLLLIGSLLSWIPFVGLLGGLMTLIGAILVILGRKAFGATHARNVVWSIVLFFLAIIIVAVGAIAVMGSAFAGGSNVAPASLLIVAAVGGIVGGLASVLFTFALQQQTGKMLLLAGYVAGIVISIAVAVVMNPTLSLLSAIPSLLYAGAYYLAWTRIKNGEIPTPSMPPGMGPTPATPIQPR